MTHQETWAADDPRIDAHLIMDNLDRISEQIEALKATGLCIAMGHIAVLEHRAQNLRTLLSGLPR